MDFFANMLPPTSNIISANRYIYCSQDCNIKLYRTTLEIAQVSATYETLLKMATEDVALSRMDMFPFHASSKEECYKYLEVGDSASYDRLGLTTTQANERLEKYGYNKLSEKTKKTIWQRIWHQVANVLVGILVFVAAVSAAQAIRFATVEPNKENVITNSIQVGLIAFVIMYVYFLGKSFRSILYVVMNFYHSYLYFGFFLFCVKHQHHYWNLSRRFRGSRC